MNSIYYVLILFAHLGSLYLLQQVWKRRTLDINDMMFNCVIVAAVFLIGFDGVWNLLGPFLWWMIFTVLLWPIVTGWYFAARIVKAGRNSGHYADDDEIG